MKNREKFREGIKDILMYDSPNGVCRFLKEEVLPCYTEDHQYRGCANIDCSACQVMFAFWLDEEYVEPPKSEVDWSNVQVDTLVKVRDYEDDPWKLRYYRGYNPQNYHKFETWKHGATSKTTNNYELWRFCELAEDENE